MNIYQLVSINRIGATWVMCFASYLFLDNLLNNICIKYLPLINLFLVHAENFSLYFSIDYYKIFTHTNIIDHNFLWSSFSFIQYIHFTYVIWKIDISLSLLTNDTIGHIKISLSLYSYMCVHVRVIYNWSLKFWRKISNLLVFFFLQKKN